LFLCYITCPQTLKAVMMVESDSHNHLSILFISSEAAPYVKTGGLGDVSGALPLYLHKAGVKVKTVLPLYSVINRDKYGITKLFDNACVKMGNCEEFYSVYYTNKPGGNDVYFIEFDKYFRRKSVYFDENGDYGDGPFRYAFLVRAAMQLAKDLGFRPDIIHANDWQTALAPYYLKSDYDPFFAGTKSVFTIHNIGYQGNYPADALAYAKICLKDFQPWGFEAYGRLNLMKGGICFADKITTVSPTYAREILGSVGGNGLDGFLRARQGDFTGILNGCDTDIWNPKTDKLIPANFDVRTYKKGKAANKAELQKRFMLNQNPDIPVFGFVARLVAQKGIELLAPVVEKIINSMACQLVFLGSGDEWAQWYFGGLPARFGGRIGAYIGYSEELSHLIEAGSDFFLMPSIYEPCGLNQMYSQLYGTLPIVRATGGLDDTVKNYDEWTGYGTGFKFYDVSCDALYNTVGWANATYYDRRGDIDKMIKDSMRLDYSWEKSAAQYIRLYQSMI